ncbi:uncharacterized protein G2W53_019737 [Senna tora]|uniref:Uncharacterized protein n=1 Tax=Senna tora TaxID=362788 RepID=A0A834WPG6_9FABA|nr:uncharacterized protein G2W53_019737 [Senna tora]
MEALKERRARKKKKKKSGGVGRNVMIGKECGRSESFRAKEGEVVNLS